MGGERVLDRLSDAGDLRALPDDELGWPANRGATRRPDAPARAEGVEVIAEEKELGGFKERLQRSSWKTFWNVIRRPTSFDLMAPDMNSAGPGV